jgi:hypothetical protein
MIKERPAVRRVLAFVMFFSALPLLASTLSCILYCGGGIRGSSTASLSRLTWRADPGFITRQIASVVLGSVALATLLGLASLLAWERGKGYTLLRVGRFSLLVWLVAIALFPGLAAWVPIFRQLPWTVNFALLFVAVSFAYAWHGARAERGEWIFALLALAAVFYSPRIQTQNLAELAHREFTAQDIFIIGFDSVNVDDAIGVLDHFQPKHGQKTIFTDALTPFPSTSVAWRSIFSGRYPSREAAIPSLRWASDREGWLPTELRAVGYDPTIAQDMPESNWFGSTEGLRVIGLQGWKVSVQSFMWKAGFPLSSAGANWWVGLLGGPSTSVGRPAHCAQCFVEDSLREIARTAAKGPVLGVIHTCLVHGPNQLTFMEALRVPGWWHLPSTFFLGQGNAGKDPRSRATRMETLKSTLRHTLDLLDEEGVLGRATVFLLADHGPRGEGVPPALTNTVMLAMFTPAGPGNSTVTVPVSLVDIAPTIRHIVGLPEGQPDGHVLPRSDSEGDPLRFVQTKSVRPLGILGSMGIGKRSLSAEELSKLGRLLPDGTVEYSPEIIARFRSLPPP